MTTLNDYLNNLNSTLNNNGSNNEPINKGITTVIETIAQFGVNISLLLRRGILADIYGEVGNQNVQGEEQQKLDVISNDMLLESLVALPTCAGVASEELDDATPAHADGELLVLFDPIDGSSNIDINMSLGTIFSILPYNNQGNPATNSDFLQKGTQQLASGYIIYGTATLLAFTTGNGVVMFSLDPETQQFMLVNENVRIAKETKEYAINASNYRYWLPAMQTYIDELITGEKGVRGKNFNMRWVAAMVADVHRILCRGGVFMYPFDTKFPPKAGKLRLMYEANPMSMIIEQAGGQSTDATRRIMTIKPTDIHQRVPVVLGSSEEVERIKALHM